MNTFIKEIHPTADSGLLSNLEKQGVFCLRCLHELANDMTCVVTSFALLEYELESSQVQASALESVQCSVRKMGETIRIYGDFRRLLSVPLDCRTGQDLVDTVQRAAHPYESWSFHGILTQSIQVRVQLGWLHAVVTECLSQLGSRPGEISVSVGTSPMGVLTALDPDSREIYCIILLSCRGETPNFFDRNLAAPERQIDLIIWRELLSQMKGWLQTRTREGVHEILLVLPCEPLQS